MKTCNFLTKIAILTCASILFFSGCATTPPAGNNINAWMEGANSPDADIILREGDALKISFPGATQLDSSQQIRRDGRISIAGFGEVQAAGLTPADLEKEIIQQFGKDLVTKEVSVSVLTSQYPVFVNGAVLRPGKIEAARPITALEAIMEAGGFDYARANVKAVKVIRTEGTSVKTFILDFRAVLAGQSSAPFYVRPSDIIFVPEKFTLF